MGSILVLVGLFSMVLTSVRTGSDAPTEASDWGEKEDVWRWNVEDYPHPQRTPKFCHRFSASNVCDPDDVLKKEQADDLDLAIRRLYNDTPCVCPDCSSSSGGFIIGIAVMKHIFLPYNEHHSIVIREFAEELRRRWSLGQCKNEIIIVLVTGDRMSSTSVGPAISPYISPQESRIFHENKGYFTVGSYFEGLLSMVQAYYDLTRSVKFEKEIEHMNTGLVSGVVVGVVMLLVLITLVGCTLRRRRMSRSPSSRNISWNGDPSLSWKKTQYQPCSIEEVRGKSADATKGGYHSENNNDQVTSEGLRELVPVKTNDTTAPKETLLKTVVELENEDHGGSEDHSAGDRQFPATNVNGKNEPELQRVETGVSAPRTPYKGTITNL